MVPRPTQEPSGLRQKKLIFFHMPPSSMKCRTLELLKTLKFYTLRKHIEICVDKNSELKSLPFSLGCRNRHGFRNWESYPAPNVLVEDCVASFSDTF